jgi:hypothetical protein
MKIPIVNREYYIIYLEWFADMYWLHTDVFKWSNEIKKKYLKELNQLQRMIDSPLYGAVEDWNTKLSKFGEKIGFSYLKDLNGNDGVLYKIYKRSL